MNCVHKLGAGLYVGTLVRCMDSVGTTQHALLGAAVSCVRALDLPLKGVAVAWVCLGRLKSYNLCEGNRRAPVPPCIRSA